mmetsp:Transcript_145470/g.378420  ORF Transcript_145470/g.378420 Transcript_145470/m.378420 type:complete len:292 (+) Transcript_145470:1608-2483(+)
MQAVSPALHDLPDAPSTLKNLEVHIHSDYVPELRIALLQLCHHLAELIHFTKITVEVLRETAVAQRVHLAGDGVTLRWAIRGEAIADRDVLVDGEGAEPIDEVLTGRLPQILPEGDCVLQAHQLLGKVAIDGLIESISQDRRHGVREKVRPMVRDHPVRLHGGSAVYPRSQCARDLPAILEDLSSPGGGDDGAPHDVPGGAAPWVESRHRPLRVEQFEDKVKKVAEAHAAEGQFGHLVVPSCAPPLLARLEQLQPGARHGGRRRLLRGRLLRRCGGRLQLSIPEASAGGGA